MNKPELDIYYHNLRELCVTDDIEQKEAILGITNHLTTTGGDYNGLLKFLAYYGENYLLPHAVAILEESGIPFSRVVDFGSGLGWLGRGIAHAAGDLPTLFVDKRQWVFTDIIADLESKNGRDRVLEEMKEGDLIVMCELLHCLDSPEKVLRPFTEWPMLVIEYHPWNSDFLRSYSKQIAKFDCAPIGDLKSIFPESMTRSYPLEPYKLMVVEPI